jgi:hypothetical protein
VTEILFSQSNVERQVAGNFPIVLNEESRLNVVPVVKTDGRGAGSGVDLAGLLQRRIDSEVQNRIEGISGNVVGRPAVRAYILAEFGAELQGVCGADPGKDVPEVIVSLPPAARDVGDSRVELIG